MVRRQVIEYRYELIEKAKAYHRKVFGSYVTRPPYVTWQSPTITETTATITDAPDERLMPVAEAAHMLGVTAEAIRKRTAPDGIENLTIVNILRPYAQRRSIRLVYSEVVALRDTLIRTERDRMKAQREIEERYRGLD